MARRALTVLSLSIAVVSCLPTSALAIFPGENGTIAFEYWGEIWFVTEDGTIYSITDPLPGTYYAGPSFSADGSRMAFAHDGDIYAIDVDGTDLTAVVTGPSSDSEPAFSSDGRIAFTRAISPVGDGPWDHDIYTVNEDGTDLTPLSVGATDDSDPAFSPDGEQIAFMRTAAPPNPQGNAAIHLMDADGTNQTHVVDARRYFTDGANWPTPSFSPDGTHVVFVDEGGPKSVTLDGEVTPLPLAHIGSGRSAAEAAAVSPDGKSLIETIYVTFEAPSDLYDWWRFETLGVDGSDQQTRIPVATGWREWHPGNPDWAPATGLPAPQPGDGSCLGRHASRSGTEFADVMPGRDRSEVIAGLEGGDWIETAEGDDLVCGSAGSEFIVRGPGDDALRGGTGPDDISGGRGHDRLAGGGGYDYLVGGSGDDRVLGGPDDDTLFAGDDPSGGRDVLDGGSGFDTCWAGRGDKTRSCERVR